MPQGPGRTQKQIARVLSRSGQMTAIDITRGVQAERGKPDTEPPRNLVQSVHRALRVMVERGEVRRIPASEDTLSEWAFEAAAPDAITALAQKADRDG